MAELIQLTDDYGYDDFRISGIEATVIDASSAHWIVSNMGSDLNLYPIMVTDSGPEVTLIGGTITGEVPQDIDRVAAYINSAGIFLRNTDDSVIQHWRITQAWDGIRVRGSDNFIIDNVWMSDIRDDGIENDDGSSGTVKNSLFDGVFVGISTADKSSTNHSSNVVTFDNVLIRMKSYLDHGIMTHQSPFKVNATSPGMKIYDSVFAIQDVDHIGQGRLEIAWDKTIDASGNYFLNLSDEPLPRDYPLPPEGFTILQGAEARAFWNVARSDWISQHTGTDPELEPTHVGGDGQDALKGSSGDDVMLGGGGDDHLISFEGNDILRGQNGNDVLVGRAGADILIGGTGRDTFRFATVGESNPQDPDIVRAGDGASAFQGAGATGGDLFDLRGIDAKLSVAGDQAFVFGSTKQGGISLINVDGDTFVRGNTDGDVAFEFVVRIEDGGVLSGDYAASDFML